MNIVLQKADINDFGITTEIFNKAIQFMNETGIDQWDEKYPSEELLRCDIEREQMFIGLLNNFVVSAVTLNEEQEFEYTEVAWKYNHGKICVVHRLCVNPGEQGKGIGKKTMSLIEDVASSLQYNYIRLDAFSKNPAALSIYNSLGYQYAGHVIFRKGKFYCFEKALSHVK